MEKQKCYCEWCSIRSSLCEKIRFFLRDNEEEKAAFDDMISDLMMSETDAIYWKEKFYGRWPSDSAEEIERHITILQKRIDELRLDKEYANSLRDSVE
jgi:hypothetical protein